jgi:phospholipid/cholesterol/gamma-HCH transport system substrate-binding protein
LVGIFMISLMAGLVVFVIWLAKFQFEAEFARYDIYFKGSVTGLNLGSPVRYSGVRVGEVIDVSLRPDQPDQVQITIEVDQKTPVRSDTVATLEIEGLTGGLYVLLIGQAPDAPPLEAGPGQRHPVIASRSSSLQQVLEGAPELVQKIDLLLVRANDLLNAENRASVSGSLANLNSFTATLSGHRDDVGALLADASATMANVRSTTGDLKELAASLEESTNRLVGRADATLVSVDAMAQQITTSVGEGAGGAQALIADLRDTAKNLSALSGEAQAMIAENREPLRDFTATGLSEFTSLLVELQSLVVALNRVTTELQRDPARFLFGDRQQGYEVRQ